MHLDGAGLPSRSAYGLAGAWLIGYAAATALVAGSPVGREVLGQYVYAVTSVLAAVLWLRAVRRVRTRRRVLVALAAIALALGDLMFAAYPLLTGAPTPFPSPADAGYVGGGLLLMAALLGTFTRATRLRWVRAALDTALVTLGVGSLIVSSSGLAAPGGGLSLAAGYPLLVVAAIACWASVGLAGHRRPPPSVVLLGLVLLVQLLATFGYALANTSGGGYVSGGWLDLLFQVSHLLLCLAAVSPDTGLTAEPIVVDHELGGLALVAGAAPALALAGADAWDGRIGHGPLALVAAVFVLLAARMLVTSADGRGVARALDRALSDMSALASHDALTGLHNRRFLDGALPLEAARAHRDGAPMGLLLLDLDHFKGINDRHGHQAGDEVLRQVARRLQAATRPGDVLARFGGEEFAVIAPGTHPAALTDLAARLCAAVRAEPVVLPDGRAVVLTVSVGAACLPDDADQPGELVRLADSALYTAKATGRDRVVHHAECARAGPRPQASPTASTTSS